ncbi:MAG: DnaJ domain-containing protein [Omnitrophica bacterium]|nr:DnaJ domain-containing protein [Candidatus Omnitrophota bacterium]
MTGKDYYATMGVSEKAGAAEIKKAYRRLAFKYHPDKNQKNSKAAEERFKEISEAYYVLGDEKRRVEYDSYRHGFGRAPGGNFRGAQGFDFDEILKAFGGSGRAGRRTGRPASGGFMFDDIFDAFQHMGGGGVHTEYIYGNREPDTSYAPAQEDTDITATLAVPQHVAQKGGEVLFKHDGKKITLKIKPATRSGEKLRIRGQGKICLHCGHAGDLIIIVK